MKKVFFIFYILCCSKFNLFAKFEFAINHTNGIIRTYNYQMFNVKTAPSFKNILRNDYMWGILFDFKIHKNLYISIGTEHKAMNVEVWQQYVPTDKTSERFGDYGVKVGYKTGWGYWSFPIRLSYRQPIYKGVYISPNFGFSYLYNVELNNMLSCGNFVTSANDTALYLFNFCEKEYTNINNHLFQLQVGAELGYTRNFFSVYFGTNYSKGLNKKFIYKLESIEKDLYANTPIKRYNVDIRSRGSNINFYIGFRFQLYPILKTKKKEKTF